LWLTKGSTKKERLPKSIIINVCDVHTIQPKARPDSLEIPKADSIKATENG
jgi:hypothetical protein